jgi:hypothetical protein
VIANFLWNIKAQLEIVGGYGEQVMPRYLFNYRDSDKSAEDLEGTELADEPASVVEAMISAKEIIAEALVCGGSVPRDAEFSVTDSEHRQLYVFPFSLAADQPTDSISQALW